MSVLLHGCGSVPDMLRGASSADLQVLSSTEQRVLTELARSQCSNSIEREAVSFFLSNEGERSSLAQARNLMELNLAVTLLQLGYPVEYPVLFLDDDVYPTTFSQKLQRQYDGKTVFFGGYVGQPPFRVYWDNGADYHSHHAVGEMLLVNFSGDVTEGTFGSLIRDTIQQRRFDHRLLYEDRAYRKAHFMGGCNIRPLLTLASVPCVPAFCRGSDDVFQGMLMSQSGIPIEFVPHAIFHHRRRRENIEKEHVAEGFASRDMLTVLGSTNILSTDHDAEFARSVRACREARLEQHAVLVSRCKEVFGENWPRYAAGKEEIMGHTDRVCAMYGKYLLPYRRVVDTMKQQTGSLAGQLRAVQ